MRTIPSGPIWGGLALRPLESIPAGAEAIVDFTANAEKDPDTNMQFVVGHHPALGGAMVMNLVNNMAGVENPESLKKVMAVAENFNNLKVTDLQTILTYAALPYNYQ